MATPTPEDLKKKALETASIVEEALRSIADNVASAFENVMSGMDKTSQATAKDIQARFNKMAKVTDDISSNAVKLQQGLLSIKGVKDQILQRTIKENALATQLVTHLTQETGERKNIAELIEEANNGSTRLTDIQRELVKEYQNVQGYNKEYIEQLKEQQIEQEKINKKLGISGSLIKGISKIPILGDLVKTDEALVAMNKKIAEGGGRWAAMGAGLKSIGGDIAKGLTDPLFLLTQMLEALKGADKGAGELAKGFNMTYNEAMSVREELTQIGNLSGDVALNTRALQESMMAVGQALSSNAMLNEKDLITFTKLREQAGFTNEEIEKMERLTLATGGNLEDNQASIMASAKITGSNAKVMLNEKDIMRDVAKASDAMKLSLAGGGKNLGEAAAQAKALGMSLSQVDKIAESLLDFESSISNELSAELLTGKQLNLEQARLYALNNNMVGLSREIAKNFGSVAEFGKMNRIQQEAAAKAVGMSREELASTLTDQAALKGLSGKQAEDAKAALDAARAKGMSEKEIGKQSIDNLMKQQSVQERLNNSVEKLKEIFVSIAQPILQIISPLVDGLMPVLSIISGIVSTIATGFGTILKWISPLVVAFGTFLVISKTILAVQKAWVVTQGLYNLIAGAGLSIEQKRGIIQAKNFLKGIGGYAIEAGKAVAGIPVVGPFLAVAAIAAAVSGGMALYSKMQDGIIDPSKGPILSGGFGSVQLDPKDKAMYGADGTIKVGTNLGGDNKGRSQSPTIDMSGVINELASVKAVLNQILAKEGVVYMDSTKVGTAMTVGTYKTQ